MSIIQIKDLEKDYNGIKALSGLDLEVNQGEIYGFLGPNGAGKTTTIKIIMGLIPPDDGDVLVNGIDVLENSMDVRKMIGYMPERVSFYGNLTVRENMEFLCEMKGCSKDVVDKLLRDFQVSKHVDKKSKQLSKGLQQRLGLAQTLIGDPEILILDEPTAGLDPNIRKWVKEKIVELKGQGKTIFLSSHVLAEVQELCDRVGIISSGKMLAEDSVESLGNRLELSDRLELHVEPLDDALEMVKGKGFVERPRVVDGNLILYCKTDRKMDAIKELLDEGFEITNFSVNEPDLEEVFVRLTDGSGGK